jgi:predicted acyl esterase
MKRNRARLVRRVGDTSTRSINPTQTATLLSSDGHTPLVTEIYLKDWNPKPALVIRGWTGGVTPHIWPADADFNLVVQRAPLSDAFLYSADRADGQALLTWLDRAPWSNHHFAMTGWSASGIVDYLAAPGAGTYLRGIATNFATGDLLNYGMFNGGVLHRDTVAIPWDTPWKDYVGLPDWDKYLITDDDAGRAHVAGHHRSGWFDIFSQGALDSFSRLQKAGDPNWRNKQKVVIGPWIHGANGSETTPPGRLSFPNAIDPKAHEYNSKWQKGVFHDDWTDWINLPAVRVYHMGAPLGREWRSYTTWPPPGIEYPLYFASRGTLSSKGIPSAGHVRLRSNPDYQCPTLGGTNNLLSCVRGGTCGSYDQRSIEARARVPGDVVVFTSGRSGAWIAGRIHADVWIQTDLPDVDVFVRMTDVYPDGRSMLMAQGIQRARYRNGTCPELLTNVPTLVRVDLWSTALAVPVGHKVRVIISASAGASAGSPEGTPPLYDVNPQNGDEFIGGRANRTGSINVLFGGNHASALYIPVPTGRTPPPRPASKHAALPTLKRRH